MLQMCAFVHVYSILIIIINLKNDGMELKVGCTDHAPSNTSNMRDAIHESNSN